MRYTATSVLPHCKLTQVTNVGGVCEDIIKYTYVARFNLEKISFTYVELSVSDNRINKYTNK